MNYKITIIRTREVTRMKKGDWAVIDKRPWTEKEINDSCFGGNPDKFTNNEPLKEIYGYKPDREAVEAEETKLLEQFTETLDLAEVIKAINGI